MLSCFSHVQLFATPWTVSRQAPLSMGFSRILEWVAVPSSGGSPDPGVEPMSLMSPALQASSLPLGPGGKSYYSIPLGHFHLLVTRR